jgi:hypothetical protein
MIKKITVIEYEMCFVFLYGFVKNIFHSKKICRDMVENVYGLLVKYHLFLSDLNETHGLEVTLRK